MKVLRRVCRSVVASALLSALVGCVGIKSVSPQYTYIDHLFIRSVLQDGSVSKIAANVYIPDASHGARYPVLIMPNSWGLDQYEYKKQAQHFVRNGYIVLSYSARGWEKSGGDVGVGGASDMADIHHIIDWLIEHTPVDTKRIGMLGISYGGGLSLLGAEHDPRIRVVASLSGWTNLYDSFFYAQTPSIMSAKLLMNSAKVRHAHLSASLLKIMQNFLDYHVTSAVKQWALAHSAISYIDKMNRNNTAVLLSTNFQDKLFNPEDTLYFYRHLKVKHKLLLMNQGVHASAEAGGLSGKPNRVWSEVDLWLDRYLKNRPNKVKSGIYLQFNDQTRYEKFNEKTTKFDYFYPNFIKPKHLGVLSKAYNYSSDANSIVQGSSDMNSGTSKLVLVQLVKLFKAFVLGDAPLATFYLGAVDSHYNLFYLDIEPSQKDGLMFFGQPKINLWIKITGSQRDQPVCGQLIAYLYDVDQDNRNATLITIAPMTYYSALTPLNHWFVTSLTFHLAAYHIPAHHHLALGIGTQDNLYFSDADHWGKNRIMVRYASRKQVAKLIVSPLT